MKKIILFILFISLLDLCFATDIEITKTFMQHNPFEFTTNWDRVEGAPPGPMEFKFINKNDFIIFYGAKNEWLLFHLNTENREIISRGGFGGHYISISRDKILLSEISSEGNILILNQNDQSRELSIILSGLDKKNWLDSNYSPFISENYLFAETRDEELISWELLENGNYTYRNVDETKALLSSEVGERLGYHTGPLRIPLTILEISWWKVELFI